MDLAGAVFNSAYVALFFAACSVKVLAFSREALVSPITVNSLVPSVIKELEA
jgi:hypothetical protein